MDFLIFTQSVPMVWLWKKLQMSFNERFEDENEFSQPFIRRNVTFFFSKAWGFIIMIKIRKSIMKHELPEYKKWQQFAQKRHYMGQVKYKGTYWEIF